MVVNLAKISKIMIVGKYFFALINVEIPGDSDPWGQADKAVQRATRRQGDGSVHLLHTNPYHHYRRHQTDKMFFVLIVSFHFLHDSNGNWSMLTCYLFHLNQHDYHRLVLALQLQSSFIFQISPSGWRWWKWPKLCPLWKHQQYDDNNDVNHGENT